MGVAGDQGNSSQRSRRRVVTQFRGITELKEFGAKPLVLLEIGRLEVVVRLT
jgi:hypothetical protein